MSNHLRIKICGITSPDDALLAVHAGRSEFTRIKDTPRRATLKHLRQWTERLTWLEAIIARLHKALEEAQDAPEIQAQFEKEGAATRKMSTADFGAFIESETAKWGRVVKEAGIKGE